MREGEILPTRSVSLEGTITMIDNIMFKNHVENHEKNFNAMSVR